MKASNYNFFYPFDETEQKLLAYNAFSNSLALIEKEKYDKYINFLETDKEFDDERLVEDLKKGSFLIEDNVDELALLRYQLYKSRFDSTNFGITIALTSDCNFRCIYCYEKDSLTPCKMSEETEGNIVNLLKHQIGKIKHFSVTWYGGEPLLGLDSLQRLSKEFIKICDENQIAYSAGIVTNGYLLTLETYNILKECRVTGMQITIDGDEETHNQRRPLAGGQPTYQKIMSNLEALPYPSEMNISIRINVDGTNYSKGMNVLNELQERDILKKVNPYLAKVIDVEGCYNEEQCSSSEIYFKLSDAFLHKSKELKQEDNFYQYPQRYYSHCGADRENALVINANGDIYKCWEDIGKDMYCLGNINSTLNPTSRRKTDFLTSDPTLDPTCKDCRVLPICMGGCPARRLSGKKDICVAFKDNLEKYLYEAAKILKKQKAQKEEK